MIKVFPVLVLVVFHEQYVYGYPDLIPEAITVYRNPAFFKNLNYGTKFNYNQKITKTPPEINQNYKYPGETKKPNPPPSSPGFEVNYDNSPEFQHEPRDIFIDVTYKPTKKKGPYSPKYHGDSSSEQQLNSSVQKSVERKEAESEEKDSGEKLVNTTEEELQGYEPPLLHEKPHDEFRSYQEPILLARPNTDPYEMSAFMRKTPSNPYHYNKTGPVLYEDWKYHNYPKIHFNEHLKSDSSRLYSEEPPSNSFEDESSSSYYKYDDEEESASDLFESDEFKNLGADTKHIYKKLLKPKKSIFLKFHSKPKFKKLKFKLKKKHDKDWFDEYPFDF